MHLMAPGSSKVEVPSGDGMVAPGGPMSVAQHQDSKLHVSERPVTARQNRDMLVMEASTPSGSNPRRTTQDSPFAKGNSMTTTRDSQQDEENGPNFNGHPQCIYEPTENGYISEDPKTEMEGFIMREDDIDVIQEPVVEVNNVIKGRPENDRDPQPPLPSHYEGDGIDAPSLAPKERKVRWIDNFGKELVQVHEYEASDTGESEEDDDDADAHACTCTIQ